jgi:organic hydroperoxide reductase OsmC/OhrA
MVLLFAAGFTLDCGMNGRSLTTFAMARQGLPSGLAAPSTPRGRDQRPMRDQRACHHGSPYAGPASRRGRPLATYIAEIDWKLAEGEDFPKGRYSRGHTLTFDGGTVVPASASPHVVGKWAVKEAVDPEEMLVAALSNCHMLSFLHVARLAGFTVAAYHDHAEGVMEEITPGKHAVTDVVLHPEIEWIGEAPEQAKLDLMHHDAHEVCFIANSVKTKVTVA